MTGESISYVLVTSLDSKAQPISYNVASYQNYVAASEGSLDQLTFLHKVQFTTKDVEADYYAHDKIPRYISLRSTFFFKI